MTPSAPLRPYAVAESFTFDGTEGGAGEYTSLDDFEARRGTANLSLRTPEARYVLRWDGTEELYDHTRDPDELRDLAAERPAPASAQPCARRCCETWPAPRPGWRSWCGAGLDPAPARGRERAVSRCGSRGARGEGGRRRRSC